MQQMGWGRGQGVSGDPRGMHNGCFWKDRGQMGERLDHHAKEADHGEEESEGKETRGGFKIGWTENIKERVLPEEASLG